MILFMSSLLKYLKYLLPRSHLESLFTLYRYISRLSRIIVLCVYFVHRCMSFSPFPFGHYVVLLRYTDSDYLFGIFQLFFVLLAIMLFFFDIRILITSLVSSNSSLSFWPLCCLSFFDLWILITPLVSSNFSCHIYYISQNR
jgi:hypothetical protein